MKKISTRAAAQSRNISQQKLTIGLDLEDRNSWYCVVDEAGQIQLAPVRCGASPNTATPDRCGPTAPASAHIYPIIFLAALPDQPHLARIRHDHFMPQLAEHPTNPRRMRPDCQRDPTARHRPAAA